MTAIWPVRGDHLMTWVRVFSTYLKLFAALALFSACSTIDSQRNFGVPAAGRSAKPAAQPNQADSWMSADAKSQDLLYVSNCCFVTVYSYPRGRVEGQLKGFQIAGGECVDQVGNIYVTDVQAGRIYEYAHGGTKPIKTLFSSVGPQGCAIDPTTGNLAVGNLGAGQYSRVAIFKKAKGNPTYYQAPGFWETYFPGYDNRGNLFVDGLTAPGTGHFALAELKKGGNALKIIALNQYIGWPGGVQWDGTYLAVGDQSTPAIYQFVTDRKRGKKIHTTPLGSGAGDVAQFFIDGQTLVAPDACSPSQCSRENVLFFKYPQGGTATKEITKGTRGPDGAAVSKAIP